MQKTQMLQQAEKTMKFQAEHQMNTAIERLKGRRQNSARWNCSCNCRPATTCATASARHSGREAGAARAQAQLDVQLATDRPRRA